SSESLHQCLGELGHSSLTVSATHNTHVCGQNTRWLIPCIDMQEGNEAPAQQCPTDEKHNRQSGLHCHEGWSHVPTRHDSTSKPGNLCCAWEIAQGSQHRPDA